MTTKKLLWHNLPMARRRKRHKEDKAKTQKRHCKTRLLQRFGEVLTEDVYQDFIYQIQTGRAEFIERQSVRVSKFWVDLKGQRIPVVYDRHRKTIVTVLQPEWVLPPCDTTPPPPVPCPPN